MRNFKQFLKEEMEPKEVTINSDGELARINLAKVNSDLDAVLAQPFVNSPLFVNAVRGTLERYGIVLPQNSNIQQLSSEAEFCYDLGGTGLYVYMVHNLDPNGGVEGFAQVVDREDLEALKSLDAFESCECYHGKSNWEPTEWMKYPKARRDDDSGNDDEYT